MIALEGWTELKPAAENPLVENWDGGLLEEKCEVDAGGLEIVEDEEVLSNLLPATLVDGRAAFVF